MPPKSPDAGAGSRKSRREAPPTGQKPVEEPPSIVIAGTQALSHDVLPAATSSPPATEGAKASAPVSPVEQRSPRSKPMSSDDDDEKDDEYTKMLIKTEMDKRLREFKKEVVGEAVFQAAASSRKAMSEDEEEGLELIGKVIKLEEKLKMQEDIAWLMKKSD